MRVPPTVHVHLQPSRLLAAGIGVAALASLAVALALPLAAWAQALLALLVVGWAWQAWRHSALRRGARAIAELRAAPDFTLVARMGDGRLVAGHVREATCVGEWLTAIVWRPDGARLSRAVLVVPDMLADADYRRLRVMLRYARSAEAQDRPASQS